MSEGLVLIVRVGTRLCALALSDVVETMRAQTTEPILGAPQFIKGVSLIRGEVTPVVDVAKLLGVTSPSPDRLVVVATGERNVALAVDDVVGVRAINDETTDDLSPLVTELDSDVISTIGTLDEQLLLVLRSACLVPEQTWKSIEHSVSR